MQGKGDVVVEPFVLPAQSRFSTSEAWNRASGPEKWNKQQGFYIYRAGRMIQSGGWNGIRALDEHRKLSRIAISFSPRLDEEFKINVPKMRVSLPSTIREAIARFVAPAVQMAEDEYRQRASKDVQAPVPPSPLPGSASKQTVAASAAARCIASSGLFCLSATGPIPPACGRRRVPTIVGWQGRPVGREDVRRVGSHLLRIAEPEELPALNSVIERALTMSPRLEASRCQTFPKHGSH